MRCYLCGSTKNLSKYILDGSTTVFVCADCEEELLIDNYIDLEDKIIEKPVSSTFAYEDMISSIKSST